MNLDDFLDDFLDNLEELAGDGNELAQAWLVEYRELDNDVARMDLIQRKFKHLSGEVARAWKTISKLIPPIA